MSFRIRLAHPADYPSITAIHNSQNEPDFHTSAERLHASDERAANNDSHFRRYVAEQDGNVIATGTIYSSWGNQVVPGQYWIMLHTRGDHRHRGIDTQILRHALEQTTDEVAEVWTVIREDFVPMAGFLEAEGFEEQYRSWGSHLDLATFDSSRFDDLIANLKHEGIRIISYRELEPNVDRDHKLIALQRELEEDAFYFEPVIPKRHDEVTSPDNLLDAYLIALTDHGAIVGIASLVGPPRGGAVACGFTGVARDYRNRGIATALKSRTATLAKTMGYVDLNAGGGGINTPMLRVNRKLGFEIEPAWITFASRR